MTEAEDIEANIRAFYESWEWKKLRYETLKARGRECECCGNGVENGAKIVVDHIKPVRKFWHLRFDKKNLQVLCNDCNMGKGSWDETDFRGKKLPADCYTKGGRLKRKSTVRKILAAYAYGLLD